MIKVFPVIGDSAWSDTFNPNGHQGEDIFAARGSPLVAVDDGIARLDVDPKGGNVVYLTSVYDGTTYYYAHLDSWELPGLSDGDTKPGAWRLVKANDTIGYVGSTGNAQGKDPHLHFELHPAGAPKAVNPSSELHAAPQGSARPRKVVQQPITPPGPAPGTPPTYTPLPLAAKALLRAYSEKHNGATPPALGIQLALAQAIAEGSFGNANLEINPTMGMNNVGMMHATQAWADAHAGDDGYGMVAFTDSGPRGFYVTRMMVLPSLLIGIAKFLDAVERNVDLANVKDAHDFAKQHYQHGYFQMSHPTASEINGGWPEVTPMYPVNLRLAPDWEPNRSDAKNIDDYTNAVVRAGMPLAAAALAAAPQETRDPAVKSVGPFAPLADRLWSDGRKHTLEAAIAHIQGPNLTNPPPGGGITLQSALDAPGGDGVWLFGKAKPKPTPKPKPKPQSSGTAPTSSGWIVASLLLAAATGGVVYAVAREQKKMKLPEPSRSAAQRLYAADAEQEEIAVYAVHAQLEDLDDDAARLRVLRAARADISGRRA